MRTGSMESAIRERFSTVAPVLDERQRRLWAAAEAKALGYGDVSAVARAMGITRPTIHAGLKELAAGSALPAGRVRRTGTGGKSLIAAQPGLKVALDALVGQLPRLWP